MMLELYGVSGSAASGMCNEFSVSWRALMMMADIMYCLNGVCTMLAAFSMRSSSGSESFMFRVFSLFCVDLLSVNMSDLMMSSAFPGIGLLDLHELMVGSFTPHFSASHSLLCPFSSIQLISVSFVMY